MDKPLSVGIVGVCENGKYAVVACDGTLTYGQQAADLGSQDTVLCGLDLIFAGVLSSTELFFEEIRQAVIKENY